MKKSTKKLLHTLILKNAYKFKYKIYKMNESNGDIEYSQWIEAWTDGHVIYEKEVFLPFRQITLPSGRTITDMLKGYIRTVKPDWNYYNFIWDHYGDKTILNRKHPWFKELKNGRR